MSDEWSVEFAHVVPKAINGEEGDKEIKLPVQKDDDIEVENANGKNFFAQEVSSSQPSDVWPSDHFMVVVKAYF